MNPGDTGTIICGKGRLGLLIAGALEQQGVHCEFARIDETRGLLQNDNPVTGAVDTLILCFVPKHTETKSGWSGLLRGLLRQVRSGALKINRVLFVSSTAVYEGVEQGFVGAHTAVKASSVRSQGLLDAENIIPQLAASSAIFRLTGLVGPGYNKYDPVTYSHDKPRQAVDTRAVAADVLLWFLQAQSNQKSGHYIEVLTDGLVYWQGKALDPARDREQIKALGTKHRLLVPSIVSL